jgi:hypothetical protein
MKIKIITAFLCLIVIILIAGYFIATRENGTDTEQIMAVIERGRQGVEKKSTDQAASCVSKSYADDYGMKYDTLRIWAAQAFHSETNYEVIVSTPEVNVQGDEAQAKTHVIVNVTSEGGRQAFKEDVTLSMKKEPIRKFLIYPTMEWKVTKIEGLDRMINTSQ